MRDYLLVIFGFATFGLGFLAIQLFKWLGQFKIVKKNKPVEKRSYNKFVAEPPEIPNCRCIVSTKLERKYPKKLRDKKPVELLKKHSPQRGNHETVDEYEKQLRQAYLKYIVAKRGQIEKICSQHKIDSNTLYSMKNPSQTLLKYSEKYNLPQMREEFDKMLKANYSLDDIIEKLYEDFSEKKSGAYGSVVTIVKSFFRLQYLGEK